MANVSSNNLTTLYSGSGVSIRPTSAYGNSNVVALLNAGTDGGNTVTNILANGNITANGNVTADYFIGNFVGNVSNANYSNYANYANFAGEAFDVNVANVTGIGNIAVINLDGNVSNILHGNGYWGPESGNLNANFANFAGNVTVSAQPNITSVGNLLSLQVGNNTANTVQFRFTPVGENVVTSNGNIFAYNSVTDYSTAADIASGNLTTTTVVNLPFDTANAQGKFYNIQYLTTDAANTSNVALVGTESFYPFEYTSGDKAAAGFYELVMFNTGSDLANAEVITGTSYNIGNPGLGFAVGSPITNPTGTPIIGTTSYGRQANPAESVGLRFTRRRGNGAARLSLEPDDYLGNIEWRGAQASGGVPAGSRWPKIAPRVDSSYVANTAAVPAGIDFIVVDNSSSITHNFYSNGNVNFSNNVNAVSFSGDGGNLSNINGSNVSNVANANFANFAGTLINGTSNISIPVADGNIEFSTAGNANVVTINTGGVLNATQANLTNGYGDQLIIRGLDNANSSAPPHIIFRASSGNITNPDPLTTPYGSQFFTLVGQSWNGSDWGFGGYQSIRYVGEPGSPTWYTYGEPTYNYVQPLTSGPSQGNTGYFFENHTGGSLYVGAFDIDNGFSPTPYNYSFNIDLDGGSTFQTFEMTYDGNFNIAESFNGNSANITANITAGNINGGNLVSANYLSGDGYLISNLVISGGTEILNGNSNVVVSPNSNVSTSVAGVANVMVVSNTGANVIAFNINNGNVELPTKQFDPIGITVGTTANVNLMANSSFVDVDYGNGQGGSNLALGKSTTYVKARGNSSAIATASANDRIGRTNYMVYNGTSNVLAVSTHALPTAINSNANAVTTGGQFNIFTGNPNGDQGNANASSSINTYAFGPGGTLAIQSGAATGSGSYASFSGYGVTVGGNGVQSQGVNFIRYRGNRDGNLSVQAGDQLGAFGFLGYNGTSVYSTRTASLQGVVDGAYVTNASVITSGFKLTSVNTSNQNDNWFYSNGNVRFGLQGSSNTTFQTDATVFVNNFDSAGNVANFAGNLNVTQQANITGNLTAGNANLGNLAIANFFSGNGSLLTSLTAGNVSGQVANALVAGTVYTNAQPNITSVGTLTDLTVSGNANIGNLQLNRFQETVYSIGSTSGTITPDFNNGSIQTMTLTGNITMNTLGNSIAGRSMTLILTQDGTGGRTLTSSMLFSDGYKTLSGTAGAKDIISVFYDGSSYYAVLSKGYA